MRMTAPVEELTEGDMAMALSKEHAMDKDLQTKLGEILANCAHTVYSPMYFRILRRVELWGLVGSKAPDPYRAWMEVTTAAERGEPGHRDVEKVAFVVHLLMKEEESLRFNSVQQGLESMAAAKDAVDELDPPSGRNHLVDSASFEVPRKPGRFTALRALVEARYGNALRYNSRISESLKYLARALFTVRIYVLSTVVSAEINWLVSVALTDSGQITAALGAARQSVKLYLAADAHRAGVVTCQLAEILHYSGHLAEESLQVVREGLTYIDKFRSPDLHYGCQLLIAFYSIRAREIESAEQTLSRLSPSPNQTVDLKRRSLIGIRNLYRNNYLAADGIFDAVSGEYIELGMHYDAALVLLYRGESLIRAEDTTEGLAQLRVAYQLLSVMDAHDSEKKAFRDLLRAAQVSTAEQLIGQVRKMASRMGGCLPDLCQSQVDS